MDSILGILRRPAVDVLLPFRFGTLVQQRCGEDTGMSLPKPNRDAVRCDGMDFQA